MWLRGRFKRIAYSDAFDSKDLSRSLAPTIIVQHDFDLDCLRLIGEDYA